MKNDDMIRMVNQIGTFFKNYGPEEGTKEIATHINSFWEPRMRNQLLDYVATGGKDINQVVMAAMPLVRKPGIKAPELHEAVDDKTGLPKEAKEA